MPSKPSSQRSGRAASGVSRHEALALFAISNTLWAGTYAAGKEALASLSFVELNALRFSLATLLMLPVLWSGRAILRRELTQRKSLITLLRLILLGFVLNKAFGYAGLSLSTAVDVALLIATESIFTAVLSWTVLGEPVRATGVAALIVGVAGVYLVVARGLVPDLGGPDGSGRIAGDLLVVAALLFEAFYTIGGKASLERLPPLLLTSISVAGSLIIWIPAGAIVVVHSGVPAMTPAAWLAVGYLAAFGTVAAYWMWFRGLWAVDASVAAPFLFIQPLLGAALGVALLDETLTWATVSGGVLIVASLAIVSAGARTEKELGVLLAEPPQ
jgi:drug/metabolite transporter (DMT)-like permease